MSSNNPLEEEEVEEIIKPFDSNVEDFDTWSERFEKFLKQAEKLSEGEEEASESDTPVLELITSHITEDDESQGQNVSMTEESSDSDESEISVREYEKNDISSLESSRVEPHILTRSSSASTSTRPRPGFFGSGHTQTSFSLHKRRKLSQTLKNMLGEAHVRYARGEFNVAVELCMEVIKEMPTCADPYHTLSIIYEDVPEKSFQYYFIAAFLQPNTFGEWSRLAQMSLQFGNKGQALMCYKKALSADPKDANICIQIGQLYEDKGDPKAALRIYTKFLTDFPTQGLLCVSALRKSACIYHSMGEISKAHQCLKDALNSYAEFITSAETNLMLELSLSLKQYVEAIGILIKFEKVEFVPTIPPEAFDSRDSLSSVLKSGHYECSIPENFPVDLLGKLSVTLIHLEACSIADKLGDMLLFKSVEKYGDLYLDVAESYMSKKKYDSALKFLVALIQSQSFSQAAVWLRYAECLFLLVRLEDAVAAYKEVVKLAPNHGLAKLNLAVILQRLGRTDDALETLNQEISEEAVDPDLLLEKCHILYKKREYPEFLKLAELLLTRHCSQISSKEDAFVIVMMGNAGKRYNVVLKERKDRGAPDVEIPVNFIEKKISLEREYKLYLRYCRTCILLERHDLLAAATFGATASNLFSRSRKLEKECELHMFLASVLTEDDELLPHHMRIMLNRYFSNSTVLNLFCAALQRSDHTRYSKHVSRLLDKAPRDSRLMLLNAHVCFTNGIYKNALMEYMNLYTQIPKNPLVPLMIAIVFFHVMNQKTSQNRVPGCINILAFMKRYKILRGKCQEVYYNMGRLFQAMGFVRIAIHYYQLVLQMKPPKDKFNPMKRKHFKDKNILDLKCEAAYNLAQIYNRIGAFDLARSFLFKYVRI